MGQGPRLNFMETWKADTAQTSLQYLIVKRTTGDDTVSASTAVSDKLLGAVQGPANNAAGDKVLLPGVGDIGLVKAGGSITQGDYLTVNGSSQAVTASPAAGTNNFCIGRAAASASSGDVFPYYHNPMVLQG